MIVKLFTDGRRTDDGRTDALVSQQLTGLLKRGFIPCLMSKHAKIMIKLIIYDGNCHLYPCKPPPNHHQVKLHSATDICMIEEKEGLESTNTHMARLERQILIDFVNHYTPHPNHMAYGRLSTLDFGDHYFRDILFTCLFICLFTCLFICLFICLFTCLYICLFTCLFI